MTMQVLTQLLCALSLYGGVTQLLLAWFGVGVPVLLPLALCAAGAGICRALGQGPWRWLGLLPCLAVAPLCRSLWAALVLAPMACFAAYMGLARPAPVEHDVFLQRFRAAGMAYAALLAVGGLSGALARCEPALPLLFFFSGVLLLRLSRYDAHSMGDGRFRALNAASLAGVCLAGAVLSSPSVLSALGAGLQKAYAVCLAPLLTAVFSALAWAFGWVAWLVGWLLPGVEETPPPAFDSLMLFGQAEAEALADAGQAQRNPVLRAALLLLGALALAALAFVLLRLLWKYARPQPVRQQGKEVRQALRGTGAENGRKHRPPRFGPRHAVRSAYAKSLRVLAGQGVGVAAGETSADVLEKTKARFGQTAAERLRQLYLPARYCEARPVTKAEAKEAKEAFRRLKQQLEGPKERAGEPGQSPAPP